MQELGMTANRHSVFGTHVPHFHPMNILSSVVVVSCHASLSLVKASGLSGYLGEIGDKMPIVPHERKKTSYFIWICWRWPIFDRLIIALAKGC